MKTAISILLAVLVVGCNNTPPDFFDGYREGEALRSQRDEAALVRVEQQNILDSLLATPTMRCWIAYAGFPRIDFSELKAHDALYLREYHDLSITSEKRFTPEEMSDILSYQLGIIAGSRGITIFRRGNPAVED